MTENSKDVYHSFSIFWHTLENWLLLNCTLQLTARITSDMSFTALGTKVQEMHAQWIPTGDEEEWRATQGKSFCIFLDKIQQGMTQDVNTHAWLGELEDDVARPGEDPQDLVACIKTLMDCCEMINNEHQKHELCQTYCLCLLPWRKAPWQTNGQILQDTF